MVWGVDSNVGSGPIEAAGIVWGVGSKVKIRAIAAAGIIWAGGSSIGSGGVGAVQDMVRCIQSSRMGVVMQV